MSPILIPLLFAVSAAGLTITILNAAFAGAREYSDTYSSDTAQGFEELFLFIPPRRIAEAGWAAAAFMFVIAFFLTGSLTDPAGFLLGLLMGACTGGLALQTPGWMLTYLKRRRLERFNAQLVDTLISMSNALKAGFSITQAFESVVRDGQNPIAQEFGLLLHQTRVGVNFSEALNNMAERVGSEDFLLVVNAIETARKTGGSLTDVFEKIAKTIRERIRIQTRIKTLTAQGRMQAVVISAMPVIIGFALILLEPALMLPFLRSLAGIATLVAVAILITCGALMIRKIVTIDI